jgi:diadenosine tetraphosphate (Ap4A) HIT family hydrolase
MRSERKNTMSEIHNDCSYCAEGELLNAFGIKICELPMSKLILFKEQSHPGRVIVACKKHVDDITELSADERAQYMEDINKVAVCIHKVFNPDKVNFGAYGDTMHHLHVHIVPKYRDGYEWGGVFAMNPHEKELTDAEYAKMIEEIKTNL